MKKRVRWVHFNTLKHSPLWKPPRLRICQSEAEEERHATWLELFYDLIFVAAISQLTVNLNHAFNVKGLLGFIALFIPIWWSWTGATFYANRFDTDDLGHRLLAGVQMLAVTAMAVSVQNGLTTHSVGFALSYAAVRFVLVFEYLRAERYVHIARPLTRRYSRGFGLAAFLWLISVFSPLPYRYAFWVLGLMVDFLTPMTAGQLHANLPPQSYHLPERFGSFTLIVLGEAILLVVQGISGQNLNWVAGLNACLGLGLAFCLWWLYYDNINGEAIRAAVKRQEIAIYQTWLYTHLVLVIGIPLTGEAIEHLILNPQSMPAPMFLHWLFVGATAIVLAAIGVIHLTSGVKAARPIAFLHFGSVVLAMLLMALVFQSVPPLLLMAMVTAFCVLQVFLDLHDKNLVLKLGSGQNKEM